jgi:hypothetical protein
MLLEHARKFVEQVTGLGRATRHKINGLVRSRKPAAYRFNDDGLVPNHPRWPLVRYRGAVRLPPDFDPVAVIEDFLPSTAGVLRVMPASKGRAASILEWATAQGMFTRVERASGSGLSEAAFSSAPVHGAAAETHS